MIALRLAITELRRITAGSLPKLAVLAMVVIPSLYAGLYVYANKDPYGALGRIPAALVVQDRGATVTSPIDGRTRELDYGAEVADRLLDGDAGFGWVRTSESEAEDGVASGRYDAALIIGPDFSAQLTSTERYRPQQTSLRLVTNDATNYLATTIAKTIAGQVRDELAKKVGTKAADTFLRGLRVIQADLAKGERGARELASGAARLARGTARLDRGTARLAAGTERARSGVARLASGASRLESGASRLDRGTRRLASGLETLQRRTASLPSQSRRLASGAAKVAAGNARVADVGRIAADVARDVVQALSAAQADLDQALDRLVEDGTLTREQADRLLALIAQAPIPVRAVAARIERASSQLDRLARGSAELAAGTRKLAGAAPRLSSGIARASSGGDRLAQGTDTLARGTRTLEAGTTRLSSGAQRLDSGADRLSAGTTKLRKGTVKLRAGTVKLRNGLRQGVSKLPDLSRSTAQRTATTIGDPVDLRDDTLARAGSYGAGLAPFFMALAAWIGAYILFLLVRPLSARSLAANGPPLRTALGGLMPPALVGAAQMVVMVVVVRLALDLRPVHELTTFLVLFVASASFMAILQALNAWLGTVGEFLGLVLMLVQLVTAGGTFPWETIPQPLRALHWFLPMTYTVDGLRQSLYGGEAWIIVRDLAVLGGVGVVAVVATAVAARRQRVWTPQRMQPELVL